MSGKPSEPAAAGTPSATGAEESPGGNEKSTEPMGPLELERLRKADGRSLILYSTTGRRGA
ncbi:MAG TPA: hypothetical protein VHT29_07115 [Solirubrobacteraceae bacterium]|jgi:hypothetical protein|nr:hypothetical protein [Solirubrobacteraceae bacterium]